MANYKIKCIASEVCSDTGFCIGSAKCKKGETYILSARTPEPIGMCGRAFAAIHPMAFAMRWTDSMMWGKNDYIDVMCPDGCVTYRLSRIKE